MINEKILKPFLNLLSNEQVGRIIKKLILENDFQEVLNDIETALLTSLKEKQTNYKTAALKRWEKRKAGAIQKEKTQKEDLPKKQYNNFKPFPSVTTNKQQNNKSTFTNDYLKTGVIKL